jgi:hypothetical protein
MVRVYTYRGTIGATAEQFHVAYTEAVADQLWAWKNLGNRFSPLPMTFRWLRGGA